MHKTFWSRKILRRSQCNNRWISWKQVRTAHAELLAEAQKIKARVEEEATVVQFTEKIEWIFSALSPIKRLQKSLVALTSYPSFLSNSFNRFDWRPCKFIKVLQGVIIYSCKRVKLTITIEGLWLWDRGITNTSLDEGSDSLFVNISSLAISLSTHRLLKPWSLADRGDAIDATTVRSIF